MNARLIPAREVAALLGRSLAWFERHRARLEGEHGFPPPVAAVGARWHPRAIEAWLDAQAGPEIRQAPTELAGELLLLERARALGISRPMCAGNRSDAAVNDPAAAAGAAATGQ